MVNILEHQTLEGYGNEVKIVDVGTDSLSRIQTENVEPHLDIQNGEQGDDKLLTPLLVGGNDLSESENIVGLLENIAPEARQATIQPNVQYMSHSESSIKKGDDSLDRDLGQIEQRELTHHIQGDSINIPSVDSPSDGADSLQNRHHDYYLSVSTRPKLPDATEYQSSPSYLSQSNTTQNAGSIFFTQLTFDTDLSDFGASSASSIRGSSPDNESDSDSLSDLYTDILTSPTSNAFIDEDWEFYVGQAGAEDVDEEEEDNAFSKPPSFVDLRDKIQFIRINSDDVIFEEPEAEEEAEKDYDNSLDTDTTECVSHTEIAAAVSMPNTEETVDTENDDGEDDITYREEMAAAGWGHAVVMPREGVEVIYDRTPSDDSWSESISEHNTEAEVYTPDEMSKSHSVILPSHETIIKHNVETLSQNPALEDLRPTDHVHTKERTIAEIDERQANQLVPHISIKDSNSTQLKRSISLPGDVPSTHLCTPTTERDYPESLFCEIQILARSLSEPNMVDQPIIEVSLRDADFLSSSRNSEAYEVPESQHAFTRGISQQNIDVTDAVNVSSEDESHSDYSDTSHAVQDWLLSVAKGNIPQHSSKFQTGHSFGRNIIQTAENCGITLIDTDVYNNFQRSDRINNPLEYGKVHTDFALTAPSNLTPTLSNYATELSTDIINMCYSDILLNNISHQTENVCKCSIDILHDYVSDMVSSATEDALHFVEYNKCRQSSDVNLPYGAKSYPNDETLFDNNNHLPKLSSSSDSVMHDSEFVCPHCYSYESFGCCVITDLNQEPTEEVFHSDADQPDESRIESFEASKVDAAPSLLTLSVEVDPNYKDATSPCYSSPQTISTESRDDTALLVDLHTKSTCDTLLGMQVDGMADISLLQDDLIDETEVVAKMTKNESVSHRVSSSDTNTSASDVLYLNSEILPDALIKDTCIDYSLYSAANFDATSNKHSDSEDDSNIEEIQILKDNKRDEVWIEVDEVCCAICDDQFLSIPIQLSSVSQQHSRDHDNLLESSLDDMHSDVDLIPGVTERTNEDIDDYKSTEHLELYLNPHTERITHQKKYKQEEPSEIQTVMGETDVGGEELYPIKASSQTIGESRSRMEWVRTEGDPSEVTKILSGGAQLFGGREKVPFLIETSEDKLKRCTANTEYDSMSCSSSSSNISSMSGSIDVSMEYPSEEETSQQPLFASLESPSIALASQRERRLFYQKTPEKSCMSADSPTASSAEVSEQRYPSFLSPYMFEKGESVQKQSKIKRSRSFSPNSKQFRNKKLPWTSKDKRREPRPKSLVLDITGGSNLDTEADVKLETAFNMKSKSQTEESPEVLPRSTPSDR